MFEVAILAAAALLALLVLRNRFYAIFLVVLLTTEFYYINIGGGVARPYHFFALLVVMLLSKHIPDLLKSKVFIALLIFVSVNIISIIYSGNSGRAAASFLSLGGNVGVAMATAMILTARRIDLPSFKRIILIVTVFSVAFGLMQIVVFRLVGISMALSPEQETQILIGFGPGFRTEANTFGKYMVIPFLLFLPEYLERQRNRIVLIYLVLIIGIFMNFTRSSIYGMCAAFVLIAIWYASRGKLGLLAKRSVKISIVVLAGIVIVFGGFINISDYARYKLENLFNKEEILAGDSSGYRLDMMRLVVDDVMSDNKKLLIGRGWGQTQYYRHGVEVTGGGGDVVTVLGYAGILGVFSYLLFIFISLVTTINLTRKAEDPEVSRFAEGVMFVLFGVLCVGQLAGYLITPEYWLMIGVCIYLSLRLRVDDSRPMRKRG